MNGTARRGHGNRMQRRRMGPAPACFLFLAAAAALLCSCAMLPRARTDVFLGESPPGPGTWAVSGISVDHRTAEEEVRGMLGQLLVPLARSRGLPVVEGPAGDYLLEARLVERELARDLDIVNAISVTLALRDAASGALAATAVYSEESRSSLASSYHLRAVLDRLLAALARKIRGPSRQAQAGQA